MATQVASLYGVLDLKDQQFTRGLQNAEKGLTGLSGSLQRTSEVASRVGRNMSLGITTPIVGALGLAVKAAVDFEYQFADVVKTVDATDEQLDELYSTIRKMATDRSNPLSALDNAHETLAQIMSLGGQLGIATEDLIDFTQAIGSLDVATNLNAEEAATQVAQFMNIVKMSPAHLNNFGSALVRLGNNAATTERDIMAFTARIASAGSMVGLSEYQILAYSTTMASLGINAELGGTNFSKFIATLISGVADGGDHLKVFASVADQTVSEFSTLFENDANAAIQAFLVGLGKMSTGDQIKALDSLGLSGSEVQRVLLTMAGSTDVLVDSLAHAEAGWEAATDHLDEAAQKAATSQGNFNNLKNTINNLQIEVGNNLIPVINDFLGALQPLIKSATEWAAANDKDVKSMLAVAGVVAIAGPIIWGLGTTISSVTAIVGLFTTGFALAKVAVLALTAPIALVVMAGIALGVALFDLEGTIKTLGDVANYVMNNVLVPAFEFGLGMVSNFIEDIKRAVAEIQYFFGLAERPLPEPPQLIQNHGNFTTDYLEQHLGYGAMPKGVSMESIAQAYGGTIPANLYQGYTQALAMREHLAEGIIPREHLYAAYEMSNRSSGGNTRAGNPYWVGERTPEVFIPNTSGRIATAEEMGMGGGDTYNITIQANDYAGGQAAGRAFENQLQSIRRRRG